MPFALLALLVAAAAAAGSLYLSLGMGLKACPLCFYQRAFAFGLVGALLTGVLAFPDRAARLCLVALPLAVAGLGVAGFHVYLGMTDWPRANENWYLACPLGIEGYGTAPQQSAAAFGLASLVLLIGAVGEVRVSRGGGPALFFALVLGAGAAVGSVVANPPMPDPKPADPNAALDTCKPTLK
jgi:disulfide bond formation protein DsbB